VIGAKPARHVSISAIGWFLPSPERIDRGPDDPLPREAVLDEAQGPFAKPLAQARICGNLFDCLRQDLRLLGRT
jgi:hypothetical protein